MPGARQDSDALIQYSPSEGTGAAFEDEIYKILRWRLIPFLMLCYLVSYLDRVNIGFAKLQMLGDLHFSETTYGAGAGIFFIGYVLFGVPSTLILYRAGAKAWIALMMAIWGVLSGLMAYVRTSGEFFTLRFFLGVAEAGFNPGVILYLTLWFPSVRRARMVSMFQSAIPLSGVFGGPLSGWILGHLNGLRHYHSWQWLFLIESVPALILGVSSWCYLENGIDGARWLTPGQKERLTDALARDEALKESASVAAVLRDPRVWRLSLLTLGLVMGVYAVSFWMPTLLKGAGAQSTTVIGWLSAIPNLLAAPAMVILAYSSDLRKERRWHVACASFLGAIGLMMTALFSHQLIVAVFGLSLAAIGLLSAMTTQWSFVTALLGGAGGAAAIGFLNSFSSLGGLISPPLLGWVKDRTGSLEAGLIAIAACAAGSAVLALSVPGRLVNR